MRLLGQFQACLAFLYEKILSVKKAPKSKTNNFLSLKSFCEQKIVAFVVFCSLVFLLLVGFDLIYIFVRLKFFHKKNKQARNYPDNLIYYTTHFKPANG